MAKTNPLRATLKSKPIMIAAGLAVLLLAAGAAYAAWNVLSERPEEVVQQADIVIPKPVEGEDAQVSSVLRGAFQDADAVHKGAGDVSVVDSAEGPLLVFGDNFSVTNGPDLFVYLSPNAAGEPLGEFVSLGNLKNISGAQAYNLPENYRDYSTVVIWCRAFAVTFATAELK